MNANKVLVAAVAALSVASASTSFAGGFALAEVSARGNATQGTIVGSTRDASAVFFNPANMAELGDGSHTMFGATRLRPDYYTYGGMPLVWTMETHEEKSRYLRDLFSHTYIKDVLERHQVKNDAEVLEILLNVLASGIGSLTNPSRLSNTFASERQIKIAPDTIDQYIGYFLEAFLIRKAERYDVKGRKYIKTPVKYYYSDPGLRNARLGFRQLEESHLMENVLYNDLVRRGFDVDVGMVEQNVKDEAGKNVRKQLEVDFVVNRGDARYYIQSALTIADPEKREQEIASLIRIPDSFRKIVVVKDYIKPWQDEKGIQYVGIEDFLLDESFLTR